MMAAEAVRPVEILLIEDNPGDVELTREAFAESSMRSNIHVARDGETALAFLRRQGAYVHAPRPDLILLDLNLPGLDGKAVLAAIKADPSLRSIPVIVLSSSEAEDDVARAYQLLANCYVAKPVGFGSYSEAIHAIEQFWFSVVKLPGSA
jgi:CheY-like chemotaxis protein